MHKIFVLQSVYFMPLHVSSTCAHHQEVKIALHSLWYHHIYTCDDTRGCVMQFWPPDDEHMCSKHVEAWNKTYCETKILCIKLVNYWDKTLLHVSTLSCHPQGARKSIPCRVTQVFQIQLLVIQFKFKIFRLGFMWVHAGPARRQYQHTVGI